jgi:hypothetical protein
MSDICKHNEFYSGMPISSRLTMLLSKTPIFLWLSHLGRGKSHKKIGVYGQTLISEILMRK